MPARSRALGLAIGYVGLAALVCLAAVPLWFSMDEAHRPLLIRVGAAIVLAVALGQVVGAARRWVEAQPPSAFDAALAPRYAEPSIPRPFVDLVADLRFGGARESYWHRVLWPRLHALDGRVGRGRGEALAPPPRSLPRRLLHLGPSLASLRDLVARIEERA